MSNETSDDNLQMNMNLTNQSSFFDNATLVLSFGSENPCPRQRNITRPLLFVHNYALFFFGAIFNFLAFAILMQRSLRCHSTFAYLAFLSFSNGLLSLVHFSKWMFHYYFNLLFANFLISCRFHRFSSDFLTHFSLFTLICVNIDRARTVTKTRPSTKYAKSKFRMVLMKEFIVASILCAFHFHWIIKYGYEVLDGERKETICGYDDNETAPIYYYFLTKIYPPFELVVFFCLPLLINIFCTIIIVRSLSIRMRTAKQFRPSKSNIKEKTLQTPTQGILSYFVPKTTSKSSVHSCLCFQIQCRRHTRLRLKIGRAKPSLIKYDEENQSIDRKTSITLTSCLSVDNPTQPISKISSNLLGKKQRTRRSRDLHLSAMLIGLNVLYLLLNLPFNLHQTFAKYFHRSSDACNMMFISLLLDALQQTFFSTNFFLYVLTNRRFREQFYNTIHKILSHRQQNSSSKNPMSSNYMHRPRASSCNVSTAFIQPSQNSDNQMISVLISHKRDSDISDMEFTETSPIQQPEEMIVSIDNNNKVLSKLVIFKDSSND